MTGAATHSPAPRPVPEPHPVAEPVEGSPSHTAPSPGSGIDRTTPRPSAADGHRTTGDLPAELIDWFAEHRRDLPWREPPRTAWRVLVSEIMLQQTQVDRVVPAYAAWLRRWPGPVELAAASPADAVRQWDRLGYPRRALRLHAAATVLTARYGGRVPTDESELLGLPGVGSYTAAAVLAFAHRRRAPVLDTNVRRVLARWNFGRPQPGPSATSRERRTLADLLPPQGEAAAVASEALMELGALVCTARAPGCPACPLAGRCAWFAAGRPEGGVPPRRRQPAYAGSDRQARGWILAQLRGSDAPVPLADLSWPDAAQLERARDSLASDALIVVRDGCVALPDS